MSLRIAVGAVLMFLYIPCCFAEMRCPPMPDAVTQVNRDVQSGITGSVASLGKIKAGEVAIKTEVTAKTLFQKYPNVDKLFTLQTMAATYCGMLLTSSTLSDKEKLNRWEKFQEKVLNLQAPSDGREALRKKPDSQIQSASKEPAGTQVENEGRVASPQGNPLPSPKTNDLSEISRKSNEAPSAAVCSAHVKVSGYGQFSSPSCVSSDWNGREKRWDFLGCKVPIKVHPIPDRGNACEDIVISCGLNAGKYDFSRCSF